MVTVMINTRSKEAKQMLNLLKSKSYAKVLDEKTPNEETIQAMRDVESGKTTPHDSANALMKNIPADLF